MRLVSILLLPKILFACAYTDCTVVEAVAAALLLRMQNKANGCMHSACDCQVVTISTKHNAHGSI